MKSILKAFCLLAILSGCSTAKESKLTINSDQIALFTSSDKEMEQAYNWARHTALSYSHDGSTDSVGPWYEAALPQREAFCMRDVSHQTVAGEILGLREQNLNMMTRFVENISDSKDWCTYWEINRQNKPAPVDYENDKEFWYNLNANFDIIFACLKLYNWTGNAAYLNDPSFTRFYETSLNQYIERWKLQPDSLLKRPLKINSPEPFDPNNRFHVYRGLPSYVENFPGLTMSADLIAALIAGHEAYSEIARLNRKMDLSTRYATIAQRYRNTLDSIWWDEADQGHYSFQAADQTFHKGEAGTYLLWFNAITEPERIRKEIEKMQFHNWNVENLSHFPALFYRLGYPKEAYAELVSLPGKERSEYPEVSYGVVEGVIGGAMGIEPRAESHTILTIPRIQAGQWAEVNNVPIWNGYISVRHSSLRESEFTNNTGDTVTWRASFPGYYEIINVDGQEKQAISITDKLGNVTSYVEVKVDNGRSCKINI